MESKMKRDLASSSGQPTQSKQPCLLPNRHEGNKSERNLAQGIHWTEEDIQRLVSIVLERLAARSAEYCQSKTSNGLESDLVPKSYPTEEDTRRLVREELKQLIPHLVDLLESRILKALKVEVAGGHQSEDTSRRAKEAVELPNIHCPPLRRGNANNGCFPERNFQLRFRTKVSTPVYTGDKLEGEGNTSISVALIDANTGHVITSGLESPIRLVVVLLAGDFDNDDRDDWAQEEFERHVVRERDGKRPLLTGDLQVRLKEGVAKLGGLTINDNSKWMRRETFRIGVKVASDCCQNIRIREGKTNAFRVKEQRGEEFKKHYPPALEDDVWRLEVIAKKGEYHKRLREKGIHKVKDFLLQLFADSEKLTEILGMSITSKYWSRLVDHAKTCKTNWELYLYYPDGMGKRGAIFNFGHQLIGIIKDRVYVATDQLSAQEKEHGDKIVEKAFHNRKDVRELNGEIFSDSMQKKSSSSFLSQVPGGQIDNGTLVRPNLDPGTYVAPTGPEAPLANLGSTDERHNGVSALPSPVQSENTYLGNAIGISVDESVLVAQQPESTYCSNFPISAGDNGLTPVRLQRQSDDTSLRYATGSPRIYPSSQRDYAVNEHVPPSEPTSASMPGVQSSSALPDSEGNPMMEGHNGVTLALPVQSQVAKFGNALQYSVDHTFHPVGHQPISTDGSEVLFSPGDKRNANVELPILPHDINPQCALPSQMIGSSSQMVDGNVPFSEPPHTSIPSFQSSGAFPPLEDDRVMAGIQPTISDDDGSELWWAGIFATAGTPPDAATFFQTPPDDAV